MIRKERTSKCIENSYQKENYDSAAEYAQILAFAKAEFEEEVAKEEYLNQLKAESEDKGCK